MRSSCCSWSCSRSGGSGAASCARPSGSPGSSLARRPGGRLVRPDRRRALRAAAGLSPLTAAAACRAVGLALAVFLVRATCSAGVVARLTRALFLRPHRPGRRRRSRPRRGRGAARARAGRDRCASRPRRTLSRRHRHVARRRGRSCRSPTGIVDAARPLAAATRRRDLRSMPGRISDDAIRTIRGARQPDRGRLRRRGAPRRGEPRRRAVPVPRREDPVVHRQRGATASTTASAAARAATSSRSS